MTSFLSEELSCEFYERFQHKFYAELFFSVGCILYPLITNKDYQRLNRKNYAQLPFPSRMLEIYGKLNLE